MSSTTRAWIAAATVGLIHGLKDQGLSRWNYALRSLHQHAERNLGSVTQSKRFSSLYSTKAVDREECLKQSEESLRKVMYLSCWGPN